MNLYDAFPIAESIRLALAPFCERIEIAGSIRRRCTDVGDVELVLIRRNRDLPQFVRAVEQWERIKGQPTGAYTQRRHPSGMKVDIFMVTPANWGLILAIRTGSARFSHKVLAVGWCAKGYESRGGLLYHRDGMITDPVVVREERDLFELIGVPWVDPTIRD